MKVVENLDKCLLKRHFETLPKIFEMFELCMSGQALRIFLLSSFAQTMNAFLEYNQLVKMALITF